MWRTLLALLSAMIVHGAAPAEVIEIADDGAVVRHQGPAVYLTQDRRPQPIAMPVMRTPIVSAGRPAASIDQAIRASAAAHGVSADLISSIAWHESRFRSDVVSGKGAIGIMQLMPATARFLGVDPYDPAANIEGGTVLLAQLLARYRGDLVKALAAYDAGPGAVDRHGGIPPFRETRAYVADIMEQLAHKATFLEGNQ